MSKLIKILSFLIFMTAAISAQEKDKIIINLKLSETGFDEFAGFMLKDYELQIYYSPKWTEGIRITTDGVPRELEEFLDYVLSPIGLSYYYNDKYQVFLFREGDILEKDKFVPLSVDSLNGKARDSETGTGLLGDHSYEKKVNKIVLGGDNPATGVRKVFLSGRISNRANGEPVIGATVVLTGTNIGAITNSEGFYSLPVQVGSSYNMVVSCLGMANALFLVDVKGSGVLNIEMESKLIDVKEVVVKSGKHHNIRGMQMGFQRIGKKEIKSIPAVLGERDIFKVATLMPGVQTVGEGAAGFHVRGSASDQNLFLLNEIPVLNTGHMFGFFSAFNPEMVSDFNLYKSNFPVEFGGRLASVFEISTRKGNKKKYGARGSISPVTASLMFETPIEKDKSSFIISTRSTYSNWVLNRLDDAEIYDREASFYDIMAGVHFVGEKNASTQIFTYFSKDRFSLSTSNSYAYENLGTSVIYDRPIKGKWNINVSGIFSSYSNYQANTVDPVRSFDHDFSVRSQEIKTTITGSPLVRHKIGFGGNIILHNLDQGILKPYGTKSLLNSIDFGKENGLEYAIHASDEFSITDELSFYGGLRYSLFNYLGPHEVYNYMDDRPIETENIIDTLNYTSGKSIQHYSGPEIRAALNYVISRELSLKASYNRMRQYLFMLSNTVSISPTDRWKLTDPFITPPISDQLSFGVYKNFNNSSLETSGEIYYKSGRNIIEYKDGVDLTYNPDIETLVLQGNQKAYGFELFIRRNTGRLNGWFSYAYSRSLMHVKGSEDWQSINQGLSYPANYDKPHALNIVGNYNMSRRFSFSTVLVYNSGRPITFPTGYLYANNYQLVNYSLRNEYRVPDYFRIDVSLNIEGNLLKKKLGHSSWMFSIYNITGRRNAYSVYFNNDRGRIQGYKLSIYGEPIFTISYNFKLGNYAVD